MSLKSGAQRERPAGELSGVCRRFTYQALLSTSFWDLEGGSYPQSCFQCYSKVCRPIRCPSLFPPSFPLGVHRYATILIPPLVMAPDYFSGKIEFGTLTQASFAFNVLEEALRLVLEKMEDLSSLAAETGRLAGLLAALRAADVDAGGDGTVVGFGGPGPRGSLAGGQQLHGAGGGLLRGKDTPVPGGCAHDVELADRSEETALLLHSGGVNGATAAEGSGRGSGRLSRVLRLMDGSVPGLSVEGLTACVPGRHHQPTVVCQDLSFQLQPGEHGWTPAAALWGNLPAAYAWPICRVRYSFCCCHHCDAD